MGRTALKISKKLLKSLAKIAPGNAIRAWLYRRCGYFIGEDVYIGEDLIVIDDLNEAVCLLVIEDRVSISPRVTLVLHSAPNDSRIRPFVHEKKDAITICKDAWIGTGAVVLPGIEIGEGAVIGSNAVVTRDIPEYTVFAGVPARYLKDVQVPWRQKSE